MVNFINFLCYKDGVEVNQLTFQDMGSPVGEKLVFFHDNIMFIIVVITVLVGWLMVSSFVNKHYYKYLVHGTVIEVVWTIIPAVVLIFIAFPSLQLLYSMDEIVDPSLTIKAVGHQWYWSYEYSDIEDESIEFDSYMVPSSDLEEGDLRLLEVDNRVVIPLNTEVRVVITGADVIHSFTVPSLGVKADAIPGRLNQVSFLAKRPGVYYGQCSEICGSDHSFMPIVVEAVSQEKFVNWVLTQQEEI
uniref:cytochrome c oxidase subunit II n=1 Tax=Rhizophysa eysenhardtii TaxID=2721092 RepID=UPI0026E1B12F|nr:cytochrome c oxidase subunit II [Rhizophysa eysenhardtii]WJJ69936.1 cytochrome c oxidase subunit 2 [Rhizophysa eysenhardtii]